MRFRLGLTVGFGAGYYLGSKAGRQRYEQINRTVAKIRRSDAMKTATSKAEEIVDLGVEKARDLADRNGSVKIPHVDLPGDPGIRP